MHSICGIWKGNLSDVKNGVFVGLGTEISGRIKLGGKLYHGSFGSSAEFSNMRGYLKNPDNEELFGKIKGYKNLTANCGSDECIDSYEFFEKYKNEDKIAKNVLKEYSRMTVAKIVNIPQHWT